MVEEEDDDDKGGSYQVQHFANRIVAIEKQHLWGHATFNWEDNLQVEPSFVW